MLLDVGECKGCEKESVIVNKKYYLCQECNWVRLHPGEEKKVYELKRSPIKQKPPKNPKPKKVYHIPQKTSRQEKKQEIDQEIYLQVWTLKAVGDFTDDHYCEECGIFLKEPKPFMFSHILSKGAFPELRHIVYNFNLLCYECHQRWEFKDKENMKIWVINQPVIVLLMELSLRMKSLNNDIFKDHRAIEFE